MEIERLSEANKGLSSQLEKKETEKREIVDESAQKMSALQADLERRTERAAELYRQNKQLRGGLDALIEDLAEARGADSPAYLSEKIENAISVLGSYVEVPAREGSET